MRYLLLPFIVSLSFLYAGEFYFGAGAYDGSAIYKTANPNSVETNIGASTGIDFTLGIALESHNRLELIFDSSIVGNNGATDFKYQGYLVNWVWSFDSISIGDSVFFFDFAAGSYTIIDTIFSYTVLRTGLGVNIPIMDNFEIELSGRRKNILNSNGTSILSSYGYFGVNYFF